MKFTVAFFCFLTLWCSVSARCVFRGECYEVDGHAKPCPVDMDAPALVDGLSEEQTNDIIDTFSRICPTLVLDDEGNRLPDDNVMTCCAAEQVHKMAESLILAEQLLGSCPTCYRNFATHICQMNCATDQSRFLTVRTEVGSDNTVYVNEIDYKVHEDYMLETHTSCSGIKDPQTGLPVINTMCGDAEVCDAEAWFGFTGDTTNNPLAPIQINFMKWPTKEDSMNEEALPCSKTFGDDLPCSCTDCEQNCKCVYRGECYEVDGHAKPCPVDIDAPALVDGLPEEQANDIIDTFSRICPTLVLDDEGNKLPNDNILTCCAPEQVYKMAESLILAEQLLGTCPTCYRNFARQICEMNCATDQSRFLEVETETGPEPENIEYVNVINFRLHREFMLEAHSSCSGILDPETGRPVINRMCGDVEVCDAESWFGFTGDTNNNRLAPVQVNFLMWDTKGDSMSKEALSCNETFGDDLPCSCEDCERKCEEEDGPRCVTRGECIEINGHVKPCPANIVPPRLIAGLSEEDSKDIMDTFSRICPTFVVDDEGNRLPDHTIRTCCSPDQIVKMADSLTLAEGVLGRCPTCYRNFARQICEMNCATDQFRFLEIETEIGPEPENIEYVNVINFRIHKDFMLDAHEACSGVLVPQTGVPAINMMCGNAPVCDAQAWFGFTGDTVNNPLAPVQVNFLMTESTEDSMNKKALPCSDTFGEDLPCSCIDCVATCPTTELVIPDVCSVISLNCIGFSVGIVFFAISVLIFILLAFLERRRENSNSETKTGGSGANFMTKVFQYLFAKIGGAAASNPVLVIMITSWIGVAMFFGLGNLNLTTNPIELWSAPESQSRQELNYFNERFGPFYRAAQVFLHFDLPSFQVGEYTYGSAFRIEALQELIKLEDAIIKIGEDDGGVKLEDVCYAPLRTRDAPKNIDYCVSMSASTYLPDRHNINESTYITSIQNCINNNYNFDCLASWGGGSEPDLVFGGFEEGDIRTANTLLINFPIANFLLQEDLEPVLEWEQKFIDLMHEYRDSPDRPDYITVAFAAERSIEDEIQRVSVAEIVPIAISYVLMFVYVTLALGNIRSCKTWFIDSKIMVAVGSIIVVLVAILCAIGTLGYANVTLTLLAINVIPFFILSVGIDNVFLMVNTLHDIQSNLKSFDDYREDFSFEKKKRFVFEKMMGEVGPSMFVSSVTQITCFAIGSIANFPAVVTFAIFASVSLAYLFVFQVTTVVAILSIDYKRASQNRFDVFCCIQKKILDDENPLHSETPYKGITQRLMVPYSKFILDWRVKVVVAIIFMAMVSISTMLIPSLEIGLDQELALPPDSYVYQYLQAVANLIRMGPPVYFVVKSGLNYTDSNHQNVICGGQLCYPDSLTTQIFLASRNSDITSIAKSSNSWLDDFIDWTSLYGGCCKYNTTDLGFCESTSSSPDCEYCLIDRSDFANGLLRPHRDAFGRYIPFFLQDPPNEMCNKAGLASYSSAVNYVLDSEGRATVHDTNFMAYHTPLSTSKDYINAVDNGYRISAEIAAAIKKHTDLDIEVFAYSLFYVFYEQYITMWPDTFASIGYCLIGAIGFNLLASGFNIVTTFAVMVNVILVVVNMMGVMYIWNIPLNAVSCVNLIVSIGISVEFCSHIAYAYATSTLQGKDRVAAAIQKVGATVITGITFTNIPIIVLAFSYTEIIEVFFFRMFFSLVILGCLHGMIFFPVLLSYLEGFRRK